MHEDFKLLLKAEDSLESAKQRVIDKLDSDYAVRPDESLQAGALAKLSRDMLDVLETDEVNYDEFFARSRQLVTRTCVGIGQRHMGIRDNQYDWVIIDEGCTIHCKRTRNCYAKWAKESCLWAIINSYLRSIRPAQACTRTAIKGFLG